MKTSSGFEYKIEESRLKNYELVEALADLESNPLSLPKVLRLLLGDQVESLKIIYALATGLFRRRR